MQHMHMHTHVRACTRPAPRAPHLWRVLAQLAQAQAQPLEQEGVAGRLEGLLRAPVRDACTRFKAEGAGQQGGGHVAHTPLCLEPPVRCLQPCGGFKAVAQHTRVQQPCCNDHVGVQTVAKAHRPGGSRRLVQAHWVRTWGGNMKRSHLSSVARRLLEAHSVWPCSETCACARTHCFCV